MANKESQIFSESNKVEEKKRGTYSKEELLTNPVLKRIEDKRKRLADTVNKANFFAFSTLVLDFQDKLVERMGCAEKDLRKCAAWHVLNSSNIVDPAVIEAIDFEGDNSVEKFLDDQLAKVEEDKKEK